MVLRAFASGLVDLARLSILHLLCLATFLRFQKTRYAVFWSLSMVRPSFTAMVFRRGGGEFSWLFSCYFLLCLFSCFSCYV